MRIKILKHCQGSQTGVIVEKFAPGMVVSIADNLATVFISQGWAEETKLERSVPVVEERAIISAPENKALDPAPENKTVVESAPSKKDNRLFRKNGK